MLNQTKFFSLLSTIIFTFLSFSSLSASTSDSVLLYTPYTKISVSPGQSVEYSIDVINNSHHLFDGELRLWGIPRSWNYSLKSGPYNINRIAVLPNDRKSLTLNVEVPYQVNKGTYAFRISAGNSVLNLRINVTEKGSSETEFTTDQLNRQGNASSTFSFRATLKNRTAEKQMYALLADVPRGWTITFKSDYNQVTSVELDANTTKDINIDIKAPEEVEAGTYKIPIRAVTSSTSADLVLEVVITGTYQMTLTTPTGLLSTKVNACGEKKIQLVVKNTGSSELNDIQMKSENPSNWEVTFQPLSIAKLSPGKETTVYAIIKADKKAIPGDYVVNMEAKTPETSSTISFRVMVQTPIVWGLIGTVIILAAIGGVVYLFRKYGRR